MRSARASLAGPWLVLGVPVVLLGAACGGGAPTTPPGGAGGVPGLGGTTGGGPDGGASGGGGVSSGAGGLGGGDPGAGGTTGAAGGSGAGGAVVVEPKLITSGQGAYWKTGTWTELPSAIADLTVNDTTVKQTWNGFGGTFNEAGWNVLSMLSASDRDQAMHLLFDAQNGAHFLYGRIPIGASDYATSRYTDDETPNDFTMASFSISRDQQALIPYIKAALAINPNLHLWASPWTPPTWMKDNAAFDGGNMKDDAQVLQALALYLAKWVQAYAGQGVKIEAVHHQNEPGYNTNYPSCLWTPALYDKFVATYLGPTFASQNVAAQIYLGTMSNGDAGKDGTILSTVTADTTAMKYIKGFGLQWNMLPSVGGLVSRGLPILQTEHKCGNYPWNPAGFPAFNPNQAPNDHAYAVESWGNIHDWIVAGANVYSAWNMVLDTFGKNIDSVRPWPQNALLTVDTATRTLNVTPAYYVFRHISQYVDVGAKVLGTTGVDGLAFKNPDGTLVAIVHNGVATSKNMIVAMGGKRYQFTVPANGFATLNPQ